MNARTDRNFSGDFCTKTSLQGSGENGACSQKVDHLNCYKIEDFEHTQKTNKFIDITFDYPINENFKPPQRILDQKPFRSPQQIAEDLQRKLHESSIRRNAHINSIIQRSRLQIEKVTKAREKLALKKIENAVTIETDIQEKTECARKSREKFISDRVEKFRKQVQHAEAIKGKKLANNVSK